MRTRTAHPRGFTLLELVLVLVIIALAMATVAPSLRGWSRGARLNAAADEVLALARRARTQAISDAAIYRLNVDSASARYWLTVQSGADFAEVATGWGREFVLPDGFRIELSKLDATGAQAASNYVEFHPNGRTEPSRIRLTSEQGDEVMIECKAPAEVFAIVPVQS